MMHFPPLFQISPLFLKKNSDFLENFYNLTFSQQISWLSSAKISYDLFFSHRPQISNFPPIFASSVHFHLFRKNYSFPPTFTNFPPVLGKFTCFLHALRVHFSPSTLTMMHLCITQCTYWTPLL